MNTSVDAESQEPEFEEMTEEDILHLVWRERDILQNGSIEEWDDFQQLRQTFTAREQEMYTQTYLAEQTRLMRELVERHGPLSNFVTEPSQTTDDEWYTFAHRRMTEAFYIGGLLPLLDMSDQAVSLLFLTLTDRPEALDKDRAVILQSAGAAFLLANLLSTIEDMPCPDPLEVVHQLVLAASGTRAEFGRAMQHALLHGSWSQVAGIAMQIGQAAEQLLSAKQQLAELVEWYEPEA